MVDPVAYLLAYAGSNIAVIAGAEPWLVVEASGDRARGGSGWPSTRLPGVPPATRKTVLHSSAAVVVLTATATLVAGLAVGTLLGWGLVELFLDTLRVR